MTPSGEEEGPGVAPRPDAGRRPGRGDIAPAFRLDGTGERTYDLADYRGEPVVLVFYPADHSPVCTQQLRSYSEDLGLFDALGATVLCLSPQDVATHEEFARLNHLRVPLLADTDKAVGRSYDVLGPLEFYRRSVFVVGPDGVIRFARRSLTSLTYMPAAQLAETVRAAMADPV
ncbi:MAG: peroxiredoxin [Acidimicrobiales bacterium]